MWDRHKHRITVHDPFKQERVISDFHTIIMLAHTLSWGCTSEYFNAAHFNFRVYRGRSRTDSPAVVLPCRQPERPLASIATWRRVIRVPLCHLDTNRTSQHYYVHMWICAVVPSPWTNGSSKAFTSQSELFRTSHEVCFGLIWFKMTSHQFVFQFSLKCTGALRSHSHCT